MRHPAAKRQKEFRQTSWNISELLAETDEAFVVGRLSELKGRVAEFEGLRGRLDPTMSHSELLAVIRLYEALIEDFRILSSHGVLWVSEDSQSQVAQNHRTRLQRALTGLHNRILFFELWWKTLEDEEVDALLPAGNGAHADYRYFVRRLRLDKPFTLDERVEQIINVKNTTGSKFLVTLWSMLNSRLEFSLDVKGETMVLTRAEVMSYVFSPRSELRSAAYRQLGEVYEREAPALGAIYMNLVNDWYFEKVKLRGFDSPIAARNLANDLPDPSVDALLETVRKKVGLFHRYFSLKAPWLGTERLHRYDLYAPLSSSERRIQYPQAVRFILDTFDRFDAVFARKAERVFAENHIDSVTRKGKWSGEFCSTVVPRLTPWVLVNYTGRVRDVVNMAHELGHAVHSMLAAGHSVLTQQPGLPLGEMASVFCEMLITDRLLKEEEDPLVRRELLALFLDGNYATVVRQAYLVLFELAAHQAIRRGASLEELGELYMVNLKEQFGESVTLTSDFQYEWLGIHQLIHSPFYCYSYTFGQLIALALYRRYQENVDTFRSGYRKLLAYGGSAPPREILEEAGIDVTDPTLWQAGFEVTEERISELEALEGLIVPRRAPASRCSESVRP